MPPPTGVGADRGVVVPSPSSPKNWVPQHRAEPFAPRAQACPLPVTTDSNNSPPTTRTGSALQTNLPSPSSPLRSDPQQYTCPVSVMPHVCGVFGPDACTSAQTISPTTGRGSAREVIVPSPSWPKVLAPQQWACPPMFRPHAKRAPAATDRKWTSAGTSVGCPAKSPPQQSASPTKST